MLSDQAILSSFEIILEFKTGVGSLDFLLIGRLKNGSSTKICIEFKNAHSSDIIHGLTNQLPDYMKNCWSKYGVYAVLYFKGDWFDKPSYKDDTELFVKLQSEKQITGDPIQENIRIIFLSVSKPKSASKK